MSVCLIPAAFTGKAIHVLLPVIYLSIIMLIPTHNCSAPSIIQAVEMTAVCMFY